MLATFAPKIEEGVAGNGLHFHMELIRDGHNIMTDGDGSLSEEARRLIGGLVYYASTLSAFGNTVASSFLRLVPNQEAPTRICWSHANRSALIRVPLGWAENSHLARVVNPGDEDPYQDPRGRQGHGGRDRLACLRSVAHSISFRPPAAASYPTRASR